MTARVSRGAATRQWRARGSRRQARTTSRSRWVRRAGAWRRSKREARRRSRAPLSGATGGAARSRTWVGRLLRSVRWPETGTPWRGGRAHVRRATRRRPRRLLLPDRPEPEVPQLLVQRGNVLARELLGPGLQRGPLRAQLLEPIECGLIDAGQVAFRLVEQEQVIRRELVREILHVVVRL